MRTPRLLFLLTVALLAWKLVRWDWIVVAPYWFHDTDPPASDVFTTESYAPPISPIWDPPVPAQLDPIAKSWADFFPRGGAYGITGAPVLRPNWALMAIKLFGVFIPSWLVAATLRVVIRRRDARTGQRT